MVCIFCEASKGEKRSRISSTSVGQSPPRVEQVSLLHLGIIEVAEDSLHSLEAVDYPIEITTVV